MKKIILLGMVCVLSMVGGICYAQGYIVPKDAFGTPLEQPEIPMGKPAEVISTNSGAFQLNTTAYRLCIAVNGVQNTVTLATVSSTIPIAVKFAGDIVKSINDYNVPYLKAMVYGDVAKKAKVRIVVYGNTANLQIIANSTGAETILGLSTTLVYATPPNFAPTVGGSPVSSANPMPVSGSTSQSNTDVLRPADWKVYAFTFYDTTASGTVTFTGVLKSVGFTSGGAVTDSATIYINGVQYDCLLGGEDSGEGFEGLLTNPVISWVLNGVTRLRIKLSGYLP